MTDLGHWQLTASSGSKPAGAKGFIYEITNLVSGRKYIGKKKLMSERNVKTPGRIRRTKVVKEGNWKTYTGSCKPLNADIAALGIECFEFVILEWVMTLKELRFSEVETIWRVGALLARPTLADGSRSYYNEAADSLRYSEPKYHKDSSRSRWK